MILKLTDGRELNFPAAVHLRSENDTITIRNDRYQLICSLQSAQVQSVSWLKEPK